MMQKKIVFTFDKDLRPTLYLSINCQLVSVIVYTRNLGIANISDISSTEKAI